MKGKAQAIMDGKRVLVSDLQKANGFKSHYQKASKLKIAKEDRWVRRELNQNLRQATAEPEICKAFTLSELQAALRTSSPHKAAGPDDLHPRFLHLLGPLGVGILLKMFNASWKLTKIPQQWRQADIRPVPKAGKDPGDFSSFRPISLTSSVGKLMERLITNRLRFYLEENHLLASQQAGFRSRRST